MSKGAAHRRVIIDYQHYGVVRHARPSSANFKGGL
jgi:hypothetical protein